MSRRTPQTANKTVDLKRKRSRKRWSNLNSPATQERLYQKFTAASAKNNNIRVSDDSDSDSDVEIIESEPNVVVVVDDEQDQEPVEENAAASEVTDAEQPSSAATEERASIEGPSEPAQNPTVEEKEEGELDDTSETITNSILEITDSSLPDISPPGTGDDVEKESCAQTKPPNETPSATKSSNETATPSDLTPLNVPAASSLCTPNNESEPEPEPPGTSTPIKLFPSYAAVLKHTPTTSSSSPPPLFFDDKHGSIDHDIVSQVPLYDPISDDSFICDKTLTPHRSTPKARAQPLKRTARLVQRPIATSQPIDLDNLPPAKVSRKRQSQAAGLDDSVIFVSETISSSETTTRQPAPGFIALGKGRGSRLQQLQPRAGPPKAKYARGRLVSVEASRTNNAERRANPRDQSNGNRAAPVAAVSNVNNTYNPTKLDTTTTKRMVIIDGSNVAFS